MDCLSKKKEKMEKMSTPVKRLALILAVIALSVVVSSYTPNAPDNITVVRNDSAAITTGYVLNTSGGTISEINITATTQNQRWKGYVGNVSGELALLDSSSNSLFTWSLETITGELYATRNSSTLNWADVACADAGIITEEESALSITAANEDSISNTFAGSTHESFYAGSKQINQDQCPAIALNVNNSGQSTYFQEVLLTDNSNLIYVSLLENATYGFNNQTYDFQMIVAENAQQGEVPNTAYYFYIELI